MEGSLEPCNVVAGLPVSAAQALQQTDVKRELPKPRLGAVKCEGASADRVELFEHACSLALTIAAWVEREDVSPDLSPSRNSYVFFTKRLLSSLERDGWDPFAPEFFSEASTGVVLSVLASLRSLSAEDVFNYTDAVFNHVRETDQQHTEGTHRGHIGVALFVLALMDNLQNMLTNTRHELYLAAGGTLAMEDGAMLTLRSRCLGPLQQMFRCLCRAAAARAYDPLELQEGEVSTAVQAPRSSLVTKMVLCQHDEDCLLLCPLLELVSEAASSKDEPYCQFVLHTSTVLADFVTANSALSSLNAKRIFKQGSAHLGILARKVRGAFERYSIGQVFKLLSQHQQTGGKKPEAVLRSIFFARMGIVTAAETAILRCDPPEDKMEVKTWEGAGNCSAWEAAMHNMGLVTAYLVDSSSKPKLDVLTLFNHGAYSYLRYWVAQFRDKPPLTGYARVILADLHGRTIFQFLSMLALQIPLLKPPVTRLDSSTKLLTVHADIMHAITQVTAAALAEPSTEPDLLADHAFNLLLALTNADNLGLVDWEGRALAYMLEACYRGGSAASHTLTSFAYNNLSHKADTQLIADLAVGRSEPFLMRQWEHLADKQFPLENRLLIVGALRMIAKRYLQLPREQQGISHETKAFGESVASARKALLALAEEVLAARSTVTDEADYLRLLAPLAAALRDLWDPSPELFPAPCEHEQACPGCGDGKQLMEKANCHKSIAQAIMHLSTNYTPVATGDLRQRNRELPLAILTPAATVAMRQLFNVHDLVKRVFDDEQQQEQRLEPPLQTALIVAANNLARFAYCLSKMPSAGFDFTIASAASLISEGMPPALRQILPNVLVNSIWHAACAANNLDAQGLRDNKLVADLLLAELPSLMEDDGHFLHNFLRRCGTAWQRFESTGPSRMQAERQRRAAIHSHLFMVCQPILDRIDPCEPNHQVLVEASRKAWNLPKGYADSWWPRQALRQQLKNMLDIIESWGSAPNEGEARAAAAMEALLAEEAAKQAKQKAKQSKKQAKQRARQKEAASDLPELASAELTESEPTADTQDAAGSSGAVVPPDAAPEDQSVATSGADPAASAVSHSAAPQGPAVEPERDKHETPPTVADHARALTWQPSPAARRKARHSKHPSAAQHVDASKEQPAPPPPPPRPAASQRPSLAASSLPAPRPTRNRPEPAAVTQSSHQSSARAAAPSPAHGEAQYSALPPSSRWPALSAGGSAARPAPQPQRKQSAGSPSRQPEGNSCAGSTQTAADGSADKAASELSRACSSSLSSSDGAAARELGRQEHPQGMARQPPAAQLPTIHRAPIRLPRPTPQGTPGPSHLPAPPPAAFMFPPPAQELLASIFSDDEEPVSGDKRSHSALSRSTLAAQLPPDGRGNTQAASQPSQASRPTSLAASGGRSDDPACSDDEQDSGLVLDLYGIDVRSPLGGGGSQAPLDVRFGALAVDGSQSMGGMAGVQPGGGGHGRAGLLASPGAPAVLGGGGHGGPRAGLPPRSQQRAPGRLFSTEQLEELYTCPITHDIMREPVMAADGHTYEKLAIADWLAQHDTSPLTNEVMPSKELHVNHLVRQAISALFGERPI